MFLRLELPIQPLSDNKLKMPIKVGRSARLASTPKARAYKRDITSYLKESEKAINYFKNAWSDNFCLIATYDYYIPEKFFYTLKGKISMHGGDVTNYVKSTQDIITEFIGIDDKHVVSCMSSKIPSNEWHISVTYEIKTQDYIDSLASAKGVELLQ